MSIRFRRKIRILPGIYINLSKSGVSTTIGPRGANINIGKQGVFLNTGIPGTGIYSREKLNNLTGGNNNKIDKNNVNINIERDEDLVLNSMLKTGQGLMDVKEKLEESRQDRILLAAELEETSAAFDKLLDTLIKRQNRLLYKLFTKKETIDKLQNEVEESQSYLKELKSQFEDCKADINVYFDEEVEQQYLRLTESFDELCKCQKIWDITAEYQNNEIKSNTKTLVTKTEVKFSKVNIEFINSKYLGLHLQNANGSELFIYPAFILLIDKDNQMNLVDFNEINFTHKTQRFIELEKDIPLDSKIVDYAWAKVNKNGTPDMRFKGNYKTPVVHYGSVSLESKNGLNETYYFSNPIASQNFIKELSNYISLLKNDNLPMNSAPAITKEYFDLVRIFSITIIDFLNNLKLNKQFINQIYQLPSIKQQPFESSNELLNFYFLIDILKCFKLTSQISNVKTNEAFGLLYLSSMQNGLTIDNYSDIHLLYGEKVISTYEKLFTNLESAVDKPITINEKFNLSFILGAYNLDLKKEYLTLLYRFCSIVIKADGSITPQEEELLTTIISHNKDNSAIMLLPDDKSNKEKILVLPNTRSLSEALKELESLIGLNAVKDEINSLINFIKVQKTREQAGLKTAFASMHLVFTGNPGTGKTTVARIVSEILKNLGVLSKGHLIETDRSGLVAEYTGQTAIKVNKTIDSAIGGVLFIDEAYSLVGEKQDSFGQEAVSTLIKRMEDNRKEFIVIVAGYSSEMQIFIESNPGLKSRFNRFIEFVDYTAPELLSIFKLQCTKLDYSLSKDAETQLFNLLEGALIKRDLSFGNGRYVRNVFESTVENQANRIASITSLTKEILTTIEKEDIPIL